MDSPVTPEVMKAWVGETLEEWLDGLYTTRLEDGHQRHVRHWSGNVYVVGKVTATGGETEEKKFRIKIEVEEVF